MQVYHDCVYSFNGYRGDEMQQKARFTSKEQPVNKDSIHEREKTNTYQPRPELLHRIPRRRLVVRCRFDLLQAREEVHVRRRHGRAPVPEPRADVQDREEDERQVVRHEVRRRPVSVDEHVEAREL